MNRTAEWAWEIGGRLVAVALPVTLLVLVQGPTVEAFAWAAAATLLWLLSVQAGFAAHAGELHPLGTAAAVARGGFVGAVVVSALTLWVGEPHIGFPGLMLWLVSSWAGIVVWQATVDRLIARRRRVLIVGWAPELVRETEIHPLGGLEIIGMVDDMPGDLGHAPTPVLGDLAGLGAVLRATRPDIVVIASDRRRPEIFGVLIASADLGFRVVESSQYFEYAFGRVPVRDVAYPWFMSVLHLYRRRYSVFAKRTFDVFVALAGLLVTLPLQPVIVLTVLSSPGPILFRQTRIGENGLPFSMLKYRTMRVDAEHSGARWAQSRDSRITRGGAILRRLRLDEIPQLWNVLRGDMSIVGPRPERPEFMEYLESHVPYWTRRNLVKPGITGWAQVRRGYASDAEGALDKLSYDLWYLRHRSLFVDLAICVQTFGVMLFGAEREATTPVVPSVPLDAGERVGSVASRGR